MPADSLFIGLDAGGSGTTAFYTTSRKRWMSPDGERVGPSVNLKRMSQEHCARVIANLIQLIHADFPAREVHACAGVAGASSSADRTALENQISKILGHTVQTVPDPRLALETAFPDESGVALIAGTGSIVYGRTRQSAFVRTGGWGSLIGDEGSGYALAIGALRAVGNAIDGGPRTLLQDYLADEFGLSDRNAILHYVYQSDSPLQQLAPAVLKAAAAGDNVSLMLLQRQTHQLAQQVKWLTKRHSQIKKQLCCFGGLLSNTLYEDTLKQHLIDILPGWSVRTSQQSPAHGALYLATRMD